MAFAITGGALDGQQGNVGKLQPTTAGGHGTRRPSTTILGPSPQTTPSHARTAGGHRRRPRGVALDHLAGLPTAAGGEAVRGRTGRAHEHEYEHEHESEDDDD